MSHAVASFVTKLMIHFPFKHESQAKEQEWMASMVRILRPYKADTLDRAAQEFIDSRTDRRFPLPAECKEVCDQIVKREAVVKRATELPWDQSSIFSPARTVLADNLIQHASIAKEAARNGWISALHQYCHEHGMLPVGKDIDKCKEAAKKFDQAYEIAVRKAAEWPSTDATKPASGMMNLDVDFNALVRLGDSMLARRKELADRVLGKVA